MLTGRFQLNHNHNRWYTSMSKKETLANLFQSIGGPFKYPCQTSFKTGTLKFDFTSEGKRSWK